MICYVCTKAGWAGFAVSIDGYSNIYLCNSCQMVNKFVYLEVKLQPTAIFLCFQLIKDVYNGALHCIELDNCLGLSFQI